MNSLHFHRHSHPGMNAALEVMGALRKPGDLHLAALEYPRSGNLNFLEPAFTLIDRRFSAIQSVDKAAAKFFNFCEGVRLSALVVPSFILSVSGSKSHPGSGVPAAALAKRSWKVVAAPSATFL